jgi:hypothetical protein
LAALDKPPADTAAAPAKRVSKKVSAAIDKMVSGECKKISEAAEAVGLARESLSRALSRPHVAELMRTNPDARHGGRARRRRERRTARQR